MFRRTQYFLAACALLAPAPAFAQTQATDGAPLVFFSIFGPNASELQRFYADVFEWKATAGGDVTVNVTSPLMGTVGQGAPETLIYIGVADVTATLQKAAAGGGTIRFPRLEVPGHVILGMFKDPAGNSIGLVEMENGKPKVPPAPAAKIGA
jgi:predicted enzyme related to lactoylglutathione lyase